MRGSSGLLPIVLLAATLAAARGAEQTGRAVWEGLSWGMTKREIRARLPEARDYTLDLGQQKVARLFGMPSYQVSGCPAKVAFQFKNRKLNGINVDFRLDDEQSGKCEGTVAQDLRAAYGKPASFEVADGRMFRIERGKWLSPEAEIYYHATSEVLAGGKRMPLELSVIYLPRAAPANGS